MPIKCRLLRENRAYQEEEVEVGDMFYCGNWLYVVLPNKHRFNLTLAEKGFKYPDGREVKWIVKGEAPNITLDASIQMFKDDNPQGYHGFLKEGVLTEDIAGRTY